MKKIVLAAVLKPINDVRMYEKFAISLCKHYHLSLVGFHAKAPTDAPANIDFYPFFNFDKGKIQRLKAIKSFYFLLKKLMPDLVIVHAVELLPVALFFSILHKKKLIYDIRENYFRNLIYQNHYHFLIKYFLAFGLRSFEILSKPFVNHYFIAEKNYEKEFSFSKGKSTVLENKCKILPKYLDKTHQSIKTNQRLRFAVVGTLSEVFGTVAAVNFAKKMLLAGVDIEVIFAGKFADKASTDAVRNFIADAPQNQLVGGEQLLAHHQIIEAMQSADFVLLPYLPNPSTMNCIPTKLYECLALSLPMIISKNPLWEDVCKPYQAALFIDFEDFDPKNLYQKLYEHKFYPHGNAKDAIWESQETALFDAIKNIFEENKKPDKLPLF